LAFYQKYRSQKFSDLIGQEHVSKTLAQAVKSGRISHAYLLTGPRGTGKTSTARLLAKVLNCEQPDKEKGENCGKCQSCIEIADGRSVDAIEIDAASHTGVDDIRDLIDKAAFAPIKSKKKVYIIDEAHMLSKSAFNALLKTLEEPPEHVVFILATTEAHKLPATILSRTQRFDFRRVSKEDIVKNLKKIAGAEKIKISDEALELLAITAEGGHRDAIGLLEQVSSFSQDITVPDVENILGMVRAEELFKIVGAIFNKNPEEGLKIAHSLYEGGGDAANICRGIIETLRKAILLKASGKELFEDSKENIAKIKELIEKVDIARIAEVLEAFIEAAGGIKEASYPMLPIEMGIIEGTSMINSKFEIPASPAGGRNLKQAENTNDRILKSNVIPAEAGILKKKIPDQVRDDKKESRYDREMSNSKQISNIKEENIKVENLKQDIEQVDKQASVQADKQASVQADKSINVEKKEELDATLPAPVFEMTLDLWQRAMELIKKENASLAAVLRDAKPLSVEKDRVNLGVKFKFHKERISEVKNSLIIEKILSGIVGHKVICSCELISAKPKIDESVKDEDLQKAAEEIFS
jgi:DNA polymerase-3 subunit gamma/tau